MRRLTFVRFARRFAPFVGLTLLVALAAPAPVGAEARSAGPRVPDGAPSVAAPGQAPGGVAYRLVDTWQQRPWALTAGRYGEVTDISSAPDGTTFVLDGRYNAVHVLAPDGNPVRVFRLNPGTQWAPLRLDAGWDGTFFVLSDGPRNGDIFLSRVDQYNADGTRRRPDGTDLLQVELDSLTPNAYVDLAVHPDGRIFLSRAGPQNPYVTFPGPTPTAMPTGSPPLNAIEVRAADGSLVTRFGMDHVCMPGSLDVDRDGTTYVVNLCPSPFGNGSPGPTPTPRPSLGQPGPLAAPAQQSEPEAEGVLVFGPDYKLTRKEKFVNAEDIAAGPAGVFVSRNIEIFALGESQPMYASPSGRTYAAFFGEVVFHLDVPATGGVRASMDHCLFQGVLDFARPADRPATPVVRGALDQPELEGPAFPLRAAAGDGLALLQGGFTRSAGSPPQYWIMPYYNGNQVAQRWRFDGSLASQVGLCSDYTSGPVRDVAMDGSDIYVVDQNLIQRRPDDLLPAWSYWPGLEDDPGVTAVLAAVSARAGRVAALDEGADRVIVVDRDMHLVGRWPVGAGTGSVTPVDLALGDDRVYLADSGRGRVLVRGLDGRDLGAWPLHEGARGIAVGPTGDVFTIGRGGWGYRYSPDGVLESAWPMPDASVEALDIAVGPDGRVYVPWLERKHVGDNAGNRGLDMVELRRAGIWVFAPVAGPPPQVPPPAEACVAVPDKTAAPDRIPLGDEVTVKLTVTGRCPGRTEPAQVALVFDTSRSMGFDESIFDARAGAMALLDSLDPRTAEVALLTFDDAAAMRQPLTRDYAAVRNRLAALTALGDTRMSTGIDAARLELTGSRANSGARRVIVVVTDGLPKDDPIPAAEAARAAGLDVYVLIYSSWEFQDSDLGLMEAVSGDPDRTLVRPLPARLEAFGHDLTGYQDTAGLFQTITIRDVIPANMRYVVGSANPPATLENGNTLVWTFTDVPARLSLGMAYRLVPQEVGTWPTNVEATAPYKDAVGFDGRLVFPIPHVTVWTVDHHWPIYLPYLTRGQCLRPDRPLDVALALDTSSSMRDQEPGTGLTKLQAAAEAATTFVDLLHAGDQAALVTFDRTAVRRVPLTGDRAALKAALASLPTAQGTRIDQGLTEAGAALAADGRPGARQVVVLLTDGIQSVGTPADVLAAADVLKGHGLLIYTIGLGGDVQPDLLRAVATSPDRYFDSPSAADLAEIYRQVSERLACEDG
jgi:Mg-chelatase subunit ChlD